MSTYKPQKFAEMIGVSVGTLQRWDREGVLNAFRTPSDRRYYTYEQYVSYTQNKTFESKKEALSIIDIYEIGDSSPRINDSVLYRILELDELSDVRQKVFAYCYLGVLSYLKINNKYEKFGTTVREIKRILGYSELNKKIDFIIKKNGLLEREGMIKDEDNPYHDSKTRIKVPCFLNELEDCHTFNIGLFINCMNNKEIGLLGFFIANYIKEFEHGYKYGEFGSVTHMSKMLNISFKTVSSYLSCLSENGIINNHKIQKREFISDISYYLRNCLKDWIEKSFNHYGRKCFVSGEEDNLIIHHLKPFNEIRDFVLDFLDVEDVRISDIEKDKLEKVKSLFIEYHNVLLGVPLTESVHIEIHKRYGKNAGIESLLEFKIYYNKN